MIRSRTCRQCEISKKLTLNPFLSAKNTPLFLFPYMGHMLKIFASTICPYILMYSALHIMQWFSQILDVFTPKIDVFTKKIKQIFFSIFTFYESKQMSLAQDLRWSLEQSIALQLQRQTDLLLCTINCFPQWARPQNMAVRDLALYYTLYLWTGQSRK